MTRICLVGGAVRDALLGLPITERDWVVVGTTPEQMLAQGFKQVGRDFPVFLHPSTNEEYALARTERKQGQGYHGFACFSDPSITLEDDLLRRDLTINAMAQCADGVIVDPFNGQADLTPERVWLETVKALQTQAPQRYFEVLQQVGALQALMPELSCLFSVPQEPKWHPEGDVGTHSLLVLQAMRKISDDVACLWAALCHDVGKGLTPIALLPKHPNHEANGVVLVKILSERYKIPSLVQELAMLACRWHGDIHKAQELSAEQRLAVFDACDAWRKPERFMQILLICQADSQGRLGFESELYAQFSVWQAWLIMLSKISAQDFIARGLQGSAIKQAIVEQRLLYLTD